MIVTKDLSSSPEERRDVQSDIRFIYNALNGYVPQLLNRSFIAGGAIRDMLLDRPIKDIDMFFTGIEEDEFRSYLRPAGLTCSSAQADDSLVENEDFTVLNLQRARPSGRKLTHKPIQFILHKDKVRSWEIIKNFGCDLSKVAFIPTPNGGRIFKSSLFEDCVKHRTLYYTEPSAAFKKAHFSWKHEQLSYVSRLHTTKYPDYSVRAKF